jgi:malonyl-CoA/methylmalonyl-CoA synthetase
MIEVRGPNVFGGYWQMPEKTAEELRADGWFITGDLGKRDADGYVHIVGRAKDLVITGGYNVYPKEVEMVLDEVPGVAESAVIGVPHPDFGEAVFAVLVAQKGVALEPGAVLARLRGSWRGSSSPRRRWWWTACRGTRWARCKRTCCGTATRDGFRNERAFRPHA